MDAWCVPDFPADFPAFPVSSVTRLFRMDAAINASAGNAKVQHQAADTGENHLEPGVALMHKPLTT
jgi:hypothetical protein